MYCSKCGKKMESGTYCKECGAKNNNNDTLKLIKRNTLIILIIGIVICIIGIYIYHSWDTKSWLEAYTFEKEAGRQRGITVMIVGVIISILSFIYQNHAKAKIK